MINEGLPPDRIIKTGSPMFEVLSHYKEGINNSEILSRLNLLQNHFFVVSAHREENIDTDRNFRKLINILDVISRKYQYPVIVSTHPRTQKRIETEKIVFHENVKLLKPLGFKDYNKLQLSAKAVLSDSGTINEESSILNFPALNVRETHERPEGMEEASVMMVGLEINRILQGLSVLEVQSHSPEKSFRTVKDYSMPNVSEKVVRIIHSYRDYVMRTVWKQY